MSDRFCPFCGLANAAEYAFCQRCGKALPAPPTPVGSAPPQTPPPVPPPVPAAPAAQPAPEAWETASERPMTDSERALLRRRARSPAVGLTRTFGTLMGVVPLTLMLFGILGVPFVAINYTVIVLVASVLAVGLGIASLALRAPVSSALSNNRVVEIRGVPNRAAAAAGGGSTVELGGATFELDPALSGRLHDGRLNLLAFVPVGLGARRHAGKARVWLLGANGEALPAPGAAFVDVPPEFLQQLKTAQAASMAVGAKRRR